MKQRTITLRLSRNTWLALLGLGVALYVTVAMFPLLINVGLLLFLAVLLALLISPLADRLEARKVPRGWTVTGVLLIIVAVFTFLVFQLVPLIVNSLRALSGLSATLGPDIQAYLPDFLRDSVPTDTGAILRFVSNVLSQAAGMVGGIAGQLGTIFFTLFVLVVLVSTLVNDEQVRRSLLDFFVPQRTTRRLSA
jgi:predicted PurR-regulated permease PerM